MSDSDLEDWSCIQISLDMDCRSNRIGKGSSFDNRIANQHHQLWQNPVWTLGVGSWSRIGIPGLGVDWVIDSDRDDRPGIPTGLDRDDRPGIPTGLDRDDRPGIPTGLDRDGSPGIDRLGSGRQAWDWQGWIRTAGLGHQDCILTGFAWPKPRVQSWGLAFLDPTFAIKNTKGSKNLKQTYYLAFRNEMPPHFQMKKTNTRDSQKTKEVKQAVG